jgi:beta-glucosidase/6-phospho-beta-glucosidase/beta-galactosidase
MEELNMRLSHPVEWVLTVNEPNMLVLNTYLFRQFPSGGGWGLGKALSAWMQMLRAHVLAYNALHDLYQEHGWPVPRVGINSYCSDLYWADRMQFDLLSIREAGVQASELLAYLRNKADQFERDLGDARLPVHRDLSGVAGEFFRKRVRDAAAWWLRREIFEPLLDEIQRAARPRCLDYVGVDYYDPFFAHAFRWPALWERELRHLPIRDRVLATVTRRWWDWRVLPRGLGFFCRQMAGYGCPVWIAENGMALRRPTLGGKPVPRKDRLSRSQFLELHLREVRALRAEGVPLVGYIHWALFDNYEWGTYSPRFGLFSVNFNLVGTREEEDPAGDRPAETYADAIQKMENFLGGTL